MASDITSSASFATSNMKPSPGEQADAIWAQKIADNTGYLLYRRYQGPTLSYSHPVNTVHNPSGTYYFQKQVGLNNFHGSFLGFVSSSTNGIVMSVALNGTTVVSKTGNGTIFKLGTAVSVAGLTDGAFYELTFDVTAVNNTGSCMLNMTTWFAP